MRLFAGLACDLISKGHFVNLEFYCAFVCLKKTNKHKKNSGPTLTEKVIFKYKRIKYCPNIIRTVT